MVDIGNNDACVDETDTSSSMTSTSICTSDTFVLISRMLHSSTLARKCEPPPLHTIAREPAQAFDDLGSYAALHSWVDPQ